MKWMNKYVLLRPSLVLLPDMYTADTVNSGWIEVPTIHVGTWNTVHILLTDSLPVLVLVYKISLLYN